MTPSTTIVTAKAIAATRIVMASFAPKTLISAMVRRSVCLVLAEVREIPVMDPTTVTAIVAKPVMRARTIAISLMVSVWVATTAYGATAQLINVSLYLSMACACKLAPGHVLCLWQMAIQTVVKIVMNLPIRVLRRNQMIFPVLTAYSATERINVRRASAQLICGMPVMDPTTVMPIVPRPATRRVNIVMILMEREPHATTDYGVTVLWTSASFRMFACRPVPVRATHFWVSVIVWTPAMNQTIPVLCRKTRETTAKGVRDAAGIQTTFLVALYPATAVAHHPVHRYPQYRQI